ncbi:MAG: septum formation family protein [Acidimicrobiales bacterium]|nr:septum formation family protein [Acidimicrobiales bacterium]
MHTRRLVLALAALVLMAAACSNDEPDRDEDGRLTSAGDLSVFDLVEGDCVVLDESLEAANETLPVVPCDQPHQGEVYALVDVDDIDAYPGERELSDRAELECISRFADYVGVDLADSTLYYTYMIPSIRGWQEDDDRTVVCMAVGAGQTLEGSVEGSSS